MQVNGFLEQSAARCPDKVALVCGQLRFTYAGLDQQANRLAHSLIQSGIRRGDRVVIFLDNSALAVVSLFAVLKAGGVFVMVNPTTKPAKLLYILNNSRATGLILPAAKLPDLEPLTSAAPHLRAIWAEGGGACPEPDSGLPWQDLKQETESPHLPSTAPPCRAIDIDLAALIYTSGSSGMPKGVMLTHLNIVSAARSITTYLENRADDVIINFLPLSFDYGLYQVLMSCLMGCTLVLEKSFTYPHAALKTVQRERVTGLPLVPTLAAILLEMDLSAYSFPDLRYITNTAAALPPEHIRQLRQAFPGVRIYSMYGLTECKRVSYLPPDQLDRRPTSVGRGMPNEEVYIVDEAGNQLGPGATGELVVRGSNVMKGYWELPAETERVLRPGPFPWEKVLHTGDLFRMDEEGYLYFVARKDDIIKSRGEKVSPKEVEDALYSLPGIREAAVLGEEDPVLGQAIRAFVSLREGFSLTPQDILRHCARHLENYMVPQSVTVLDTLPKTSSGKIRKLDLKQWKGTVSQ